jgi:hypothetical protein
VKHPGVAAERTADRHAHVRRPGVTAEHLADRRAHYFMDQQIGLHGTIVSLALGVAGLAAASLFEVSPASRPYHPLLWLLWCTSLVGVGIVYSGMTVNVYALPSTIPSALDMFLPVGVGLMEFMLFAVLTSPLNSQLSPHSVVVVWFGCFCAFGCFASLVIIRIRWLFEHTVYESPEIQAAVYQVFSLLRRDLGGASGSAFVSAAMAIVIGWVHALPLKLAYVVAALLVVGMSSGVVNQRRQARILETALSRLAATASSVQTEAARTARSKAEAE